LGVRIEILLESILLHRLLHRFGRNFWIKPNLGIFYFVIMYFFVFKYLEIQHFCP
jgi:hypothetical protein